MAGRSKCVNRVSHEIDALRETDCRDFGSAELVRWAALVHCAVAGRPQPAADRTTLPNGLKRLHAAIAGAPKKFGFPKWVARLPINRRRVKKKKESGAARASTLKAVRALTAEADRYVAEFKSQTRPREG